MGDSQTFGSGLKLKDTWPKQFEHELNQSDTDKHFEVLNSGLPSSDTWQHELIFNRMITNYAPDAAVLAFYTNDVVKRFKPNPSLNEAKSASYKKLIKWIETGDESAKVRSDIQFQESLEYEMLGLVEFYSAKTGVKNYDEGEKFQAPRSGLTQKIIQVTENMKSRCDIEFRNESKEFDSDEIEIEWFNCINEAEKWKSEHIP